MQYEGIRAEHVAVRTGAGVFDVSHMGEIETRGPRRRGVPAAPALQRRRRSSPSAARSTRVLCREDGGVLDDLFTYRLGAGPLPDRHQRLQPREGPRVVPAPRRRLRRRGARRAATTTRCSPSRARRRASIARRARRRRRCPRASRRRAHASPARPALVCGTGYTGEDGVELLLAPDGAPARLGRAARAPARRPPGLGARDTLRLEVCFHLYGNDLIEDRDPIEAGLGWCCKEDTGFIGAEARRAPSARPARREARAVRAHRPGHRRARATRSSAAAAR